MAYEINGLCRCGCGQKTAPAPRTRRNLGWIKGQPQPYCNGHGRRAGRDVNEARDLIRDLDPGFGHWLAGFIDGEGCFTIKRNGQNASYCSFSIHLHSDDKEILSEIARRTGIGQVRDYSYREASVWVVCAKAECALLVDLLSRFPMRAKKRRDYEIWAKAVAIWQNREWGSDSSEIYALRDELVADRKGIGGRKRWSA